MIFERFFGQRSVTAAWVTRSPWSILGKKYKQISPKWVKSRRCRKKEEEEKRKQAGAELCQAQEKFCLVCLVSKFQYFGLSWTWLSNVGKQCFWFEAVLILFWVGGWWGMRIDNKAKTQFNCYCNCLLELSLAKEKKKYSRDCGWPWRPWPNTCRKKEEKKKAKVGDNKGQATHGARKHAWRTQAAWANMLDKVEVTSCHD